MKHGNSMLQYAEMIRKNNKSYGNFLRGCKTPSTRISYVSWMKRFIQFLADNRYVSNEQNYDELLDLNTEQITDYLIAWAEHLDQSNVVPKTISSMLSSPELFFEMNRKLWHKKLVRRGIGKDGREQPGRVPITNEEIRSMLEATKKLRTKAFVHFISSTGIRPGAIVDPILRIKHLVDMPNPNNPTHDLKWCYAIRIYDESREGYWGFLTPESRKALDRYFSSRKLNGENLTSESPIFSNVSNNKIKHFESASARTMIYKLIKITGMSRKKIGSRYDKAVMNMFRKRFNTIMKLNNDVNSNIVEKLMAHKRGLDGTYLQPTREECFREFVKAIPQLTIDSTEKLKLENEKKQEKIDQLEARTKEVIEKTKINEKLEERVKKMEEMLMRSNFPETN